jgi:hypothetical protein
MPWVPVMNVGTVGIVRDQTPTNLPPEVWTGGSNVRFRDGVAEKVGGITQPFGTPTIAPFFNIPLKFNNNIHWIYSGLTKAYVVHAGVHKEITRVSGDYNTLATRGWNGGVLGGVPILNNGIDVPQMWAAPDFSTPTKLEDLSNWPANMTARVIRPFKQYLVALGLTIDAVDMPMTLRWSHPADPGSVPISWDIADPSKDCGQTSLSETDGAIVDCRRLGDVNVIYKEDSYHSMQFIGGKNIFRFGGLSETTGAMSANCIASTPKGHAVFGPDDIYVHNGGEPSSIISGRVRKWLFNALDQNNFEQCFAVANPQFNEVWFCFPEQGMGYCTHAVIWNWVDGSVGQREIPGIMSAYPGPLETTTEGTWDSNTQVWDDDTELWDKRNYGITRELIASGTSGTKLLQFDEGESEDGVNMISSLERTGLAITGQDRLGNPIVDLNIVKFVRGLRPIIEGSGTIEIYVGSQQFNVNEPVTWKGPFNYTIGSDLSISPLVSGRLLAIRYRSNSSTSWKLRGYWLDLEALGQF